MGAIDHAFAWTPPDGDILGAITLPKVPTEPLTRQTYRFALMDKIDRMVARETPNLARKLLKVAYQREGLDLWDHPHLAGEVLVENSDELAGHCCFGRDPIPLQELVHEPATLRRLVDRPMSLAGFLTKLYAK